VGHKNVTNKKTRGKLLHCGHFNGVLIGLEKRVFLLVVKKSCKNNLQEDKKVSFMLLEKPAEQLTLNDQIRLLI